MMAAMMLSSTTTLFNIVHRLAVVRCDGKATTYWSPLGSPRCGSSSGLAFRAGHVVMHAVVGAMDGRLDDRMVGAAALVAAGGFQFASLKSR